MSGAGKIAAAALTVLIPAGAWWAAGKLPNTPRPSARVQGLASFEEGLRLARAKRHVEALDALRIALLKLAQDRRDNRAGNPEVESRILLAVGRSHHELGDWWRAAEAYEGAARLLSENKGIPGAAGLLEEARRGAKIAREKERRAAGPQEKP